MATHHRYVCKHGVIVTQCKCVALYKEDLLADHCPPNCVEGQLDAQVAREADSIIREAIAIAQTSPLMPREPENYDDID